MTADVIPCRHRFGEGGLANANPRDTLPPAPKSMPSGPASQVARFLTAETLMADAAGRFVSVAAQSIRESDRFVVALWRTDRHRGDSARCTPE